MPKLELLKTDGQARHGLLTTSDGVVETRFGKLVVFSAIFKPFIGHTTC